MNNTLLLLLIISLLILSCNVQNIKKARRPNTDTNSVEIHDPIILAPYTIKNTEQSVTLPDTIGGKNLTGYVVIKLLINNHSEILETSILKLYIVDVLDNEIMRYDISDANLPIDLNKYAKFFDTYCKEKLIIEKTGTPNRKNVIMISLKIE